MIERLKLAALIVALIFGSFFVVTALAQSTTAASASYPNQRRGMMGGTTSQSKGALGRGMMSGMMGGGTGQFADFDDMGEMMNFTAGSAWQGMVSYCTNMTTQFANWFGNATSP